MTALLTCGHTRSGLAAVRSLGRAGIAVVVAAPQRPALAMWSRFTTSTVVVADAAKSPRLFAEQVAEQAIGRSATSVSWSTDSAAWALSRFRDMLPASVRAALPPHDAMVRAVDRPALLDLASSLGIPCIETIRIDARSALEPALRQAARMGMPCRIRPVVGWSEREDGGGRVPDGIVVSRIADLRRLLYAREDLVDGGCLIEPRPVGRTMGYGVVCTAGVPVAEVFQERLRESEEFSGVSTAARTIDVDPAIRQLGRRLLEALHWHGPAMLEFVRGDDGPPILIGLTGRLWGSVQLAVRAGADVPLLCHRLASGETLSTTTVARPDVVFRWLLGDTRQAWTRMTGAPDARDGGIPMLKRARALVDLVGAPAGVLANDVLDADDPMPFLFEIQELANHARRKSP